MSKQNNIHLGIFLGAYAVKKGQKSLYSSTGLQNENLFYRDYWDRIFCYFLAYNDTIQNYSIYYLVENLTEARVRYWLSKMSSSGSQKDMFYIFEVDNNIVVKYNNLPDGAIFNNKKCEFGDFSVKVNFEKDDWPSYCICLTSKYRNVFFGWEELSLFRTYRSLHLFKKEHEIKKGKIKKLNNLSYEQFKLIANEIIEGIDTYVDSIDLDLILKDLQIRIWAHTIYKRGDSDMYIEYESREISYPIVDDYYLNSLIKLGKRETSRSFEYGSNSKSGRDYDIVLNDKEVEKVRKKIINEYSSEKHRDYLFRKNKYFSHLMAFLNDLFDDSYVVKRNLFFDKCFAYNLENFIQIFKCKSFDEIIEKANDYLSLNKRMKLY